MPSLNDFSSGGIEIHVAQLKRLLLEWHFLNSCKPIKFFNLLFVHPLLNSIDWIVNAAQWRDRSVSEKWPRKQSFLCVRVSIYNLTGCRVMTGSLLLLSLVLR